MLRANPDFTDAGENETAPVAGELALTAHLGPLIASPAVSSLRG